MQTLILSKTDTNEMNTTAMPTFIFKQMIMACGLGVGGGGMRQVGGGGRGECVKLKHLSTKSDNENSNTFMKKA